MKVFRTLTSGLCLLEMPLLVLQFAMFQVFWPSLHISQPCSTSIYVSSLSFSSWSSLSMQYFWWRQNATLQTPCNELDMNEHNKFTGYCSFRHTYTISIYNTSSYLSSSFRISSVSSFCTVGLKKKTNMQDLHYMLIFIKGWNCYGHL